MKIFCSSWNMSRKFTSITYLYYILKCGENLWQRSLEAGWDDPMHTVVGVILWPKKSFKKNSRVKVHHVKPNTSVSANSSGRENNFVITNVDIWFKLGHLLFFCWEEMKEMFPVWIVNLFCFPLNRYVDFTFRLCENTNQTFFTIQPLFGFTHFTLTTQAGSDNKNS